MDWGNRRCTKKLEIKIENNCVTKGIPITLDNLQATAEWKTNHLGIFELKLEEDTIQVSSDSTN